MAFSLDTPFRPCYDALSAMKFIGAILGIVVFVVGVALVADVFYTAYGLFNAAPPPLPAPTVTAATAKTGEATASATTAITSSLVDFVKKLLLLLLMSVAGAIIASLGSSLFFRSLAASPTSGPTPSLPPTPALPTPAAPTAPD